MYLIPAPAKLEKKEGRFIWAYDRYVTVDQSCSQLVTRQASLFCDGAEKELGYRPLLTRGAAKAGDVVFKQDDTMKAQSYVLDITEDAIVLTGDEAGLWHGTAADHRTGGRMPVRFTYRGCSGYCKPRLLLRLHQRTYPEAFLVEAAG